MRTKNLLKLLLVIALMMCLLFSFAACKRGDTPPEDDDDPPAVEPGDPGDNTPVDVFIVKDGASDYVIVYGKDNSKGGTYAYSLNSELAKLPGGKTLEFKTDEAAATGKELLLGDTDRQLSADLKAALTASAAADSHVWGFAYRDGQFAFYFNTQVAFNKGLEELKTLYLKDGAFTVKSDAWKITELTLADYNAELKAEQDALKKEDLAKREAAATAALKDFTNAQFGATEDWLTEYAMPTNVYADPLSAITEEHPRLFFTKDEVPKIKALIENEEYVNMTNNLWSLADSKNFTGTFPEKTHSNGETYRYDTTILAQIEARALAYVLTGEKAYAYEAIMGIKNAMLSLKFTVENHMDVYHGPSHLMFVLAEVYDWCYNALTDTDKAQLISGCVYLLINAEHLGDDDFVLDKNKPSIKKVNDPGRKPYGLEFNFPPNNYNAVTGHGPGPQFLRDYMMVTIAFADEMPTWWDYVGGRFYQEYLPVAELLYLNGNVSQGTSCYAPIRIYTNLLPAFIIQTATGENPYPEYLKECSNFMLSHLMGNNKLFETGDGPRTGDGVNVVYAYFYFFAAMYNDTFSLQAAKYYSNGYKNYTGDNIYTMTPALTLALCAQCDKASGVYPDDMPLITYTKYPAGQTTARNNWTSDAAVVFMKINERTLAAHDLMDSGTFQIYHKGLLACTSGTYADYGSTHHKMYMQSTISMNGLLIYNPALASNPAYKGWYTGSQNQLDSASSLGQLNSSIYNVAKVTGVQNDFTSKKANYAYLAGDITASYNVNTVDEVERRMLAVFTGDASIPMVYFVYDNITSTDASFKKTFLLHTVKEPTIAGAATDKSFTVTPDANGQMTATVINGGGKLVLTNVIGGDYMHKVGGEGFAYWIGNNNEFDGTSNSGFNGVDQHVPTDNADKIWGRIEVTTRGDKTSQLLNTMYVTDAEGTKTLTSVAIDTDDVAGATMSNITAIFVRDSVRRSSALEFTTSGSGTMKYYISGMYQGTWNVFVNGEQVTTAKATEEGGLLSFSAPTGNVRLVPGDDIIPEGHSFITYDVNGGAMPQDYPTTYEEGVGINLADVIPTHPTNRFGGWFFDSEFTQPAYIIDSTKTGNIKLYAKWQNGILNVDFSKGEAALQGLGFQEKGGSLKIATDGNGKSYLQWIQGPEDSLMNATSTTNNFSTITDPNSQVSLTFNIAKEAGKDILSSRVLILAGSANGGGDFYVFRIMNTGDVLLGANAQCNLGQLTEEGMTLRILLDWKEATLSAYDAEGNIITSTPITLPAAATDQGYTTLDQWRREKLVQYNLYFHATGSQQGKALRVNSITYFEGNEYWKPEVPTLDPEIRYNLSGGTLPSGAPKVYTEGEAFDLSGIIPTHPLRNFGGWYFDKDLTEKATEIPATATGNIQLYAKWLYKFVDVDFSKETVNGSNGTTTENSTGLIFSTTQKPTSSFITKTDGEGKSYLEWCRGDVDSFMYQQDGSGANNFAAMRSEDHVISLEFDLSMIEGKAAISARYLLIVPGAEGGEAINVFQIKPNGDVVLNLENNGTYTADEVICNIQNGAKIKVTVDFKNAKFTGYREDGTTVVKDIVLPESVAGQFATVDEWRAAKLSKYLVYFHGFGDDDPNCALRINRITIVDGNIYG